MLLSVGVDFGTLSARAVIIDAASGSIVSEAESKYSYYTGQLPNGTELPAEMVLADPRSYRAALIECVKNAASAVDASLIKGIAVDATSLSLVATDAQGVPMSEKPDWAPIPDAWIKLWKSHSAEKEARIIQDAAESRSHPLLKQCGGYVSSEWAYPKMLETYIHSPALFKEVDTFWDLCDWLTFLLCGEKTRSVNAMCCKFQFDGNSLPQEGFLNNVYPDFGTALNGKLNGQYFLWGERAGNLLPGIASEMGLPAGIAVGAGSLDGHIGMAALGLQNIGDCMLTVGTSTVCAVLGKEKKYIHGVCGSGMDALIPGKFAYDSGQASVGDIFAWFTENLLPDRFIKRAEERNITVHELLSRAAFSRPPKLSDPIALESFNGNRCPRGDLNLRGALYGLSLTAGPEDIYRALVEATAFGVRNIIEGFEKQGVPVNRIRAAGGIAKKNPWLIQCYTDVLGRPIEVSALSNGAAAGAAITAASAAGIFTSLSEAMNALSEKNFVHYNPLPERAAVYAERYERYLQMDGFFGDNYGR